MAEQQLFFLTLSKYIRTKIMPCFLILVGTVACESEGEILLEDTPEASTQTPEDRIDMEQTQKAINGTALFNDDSCTQTHKNKLRNALSLAHDLLTSRKSELLDCMKKTILNNDNHRTRYRLGYPENIVDQLAENLPTSLYCEDMASSSTVATAPENVSYESMTANTDWLHKNANFWAGEILHEVAHNKAYHHRGPVNKKPSGDKLIWGYEGEHCVNQQIEMCGKAILNGDSDPMAYGLNRKSMANEVELASVGENGGLPFGVRCDPNRYVSGLELASRTNSNVTYIASMRMKCQYAWNSTTTTTTGRVGPINTTHSLTCPSGKIAVGVRGKADRSINRIGLICKDKQKVYDGQSSSTTNTGVFGGSSGIDFKRLCPNDMAIKEIRGRTYAWMDKLEIVCQNPNTWETRQITKLTRVGPTENAFNPMQIRCAGRGMMIGLFGKYGSAIDKLGGACTQIDRKGDDQIERIGTPYIMPAVGGYGDTGTETLMSDDCNNDEALVGIEVIEGNMIYNVRGVCAQIDSWTDGNTTTRKLPARGGGGGSVGTPDSRMCPTGSFMVGWDISDGIKSPWPTVVHNIAPVCRNFDRPNTSCGSGKVYDCDMDCVVKSVADAWTNNGRCDQNNYSSSGIKYNLYCEEFDYDGNDC